MGKGEQTRQHVIAEAAKIFNQHGYEGSSMLEIMQATNLQKGGIYRHFSSKEKLAEEAFDYAWKTAREARSANLEEEENSLARIKRFIANFVDVRPAVPGGCPLMNAAIDTDDGNAAVRKRVVLALREWRSHLAGMVERGIQDGEIQRDVDGETVATIIIACLEGALMMNRLEPGAEPLLKAQRHLNGYLDSCAATQNQANES